MGLMGEEVVSLVALSVSDWVRWWVWSEVRSAWVVFSRSRLVVRQMVSPSLLVWMVIVVVSRTVSWTVRVTVSITVSWTASLWVCWVMVLLLLQLTVNRASVAMRAVVTVLRCAIERATGSFFIFCIAFLKWFTSVRNSLTSRRRGFLRTRFNASAKQASLLCSRLKKRSAIFSLNSSTYIFDRFLTSLF